MATLVHDDVIDDADKRRGQLTVRSKWDNRVAMYTGDYIFGRALTVATMLDKPQIHQVLSRAIVQMCIGEMEQIRLFFQVNQSLRDYLQRIKRKTALLLAVSCQLGGLAVDASEPYSRALYDFGYNAGMAFQIIDDLLDIEGTEAEIGKPPGSDVRQGNITLPYLLAMNGEPQDSFVREQILAISESPDNERIAALIRHMRKHSALEVSRQIAQRYIDKADSALDRLPDTRAKTDLRKIAQFIIRRSY
jgi:heptaprenyl diphosphate synthase